MRTKTKVICKIEDKTSGCAVNCQCRVFYECYICTVECVNPNPCVHLALFLIRAFIFDPSS